MARQMIPNEKNVRTVAAEEAAKTRAAKTNRTIATVPAAAAAPTKAEYDNLKAVVDNLRAALTESGLTK